MADAGDAATNEEVKPYKIHVSSRYLDLTRQKLELTRLPHEGSPPKSEDWWEPKSEVEPLIDYWLDKYSWKDQEAHFNETLPQFRTAISVVSSETPLRLHFVHVRSPHVNALPLLLIPPFPFTSLSFAQVVTPLTDPEDAVHNQPFHLVIPSLPGLAYSDPLPTNASPIATTAEMLDRLMARLGYTHYLATNAGAAHASPSNIDYRLARRLATAYPNSCLGTHFIAPPLDAPKANEAPWEWAKWAVAKFFGAAILGYSGDDFAALKRVREDAGPAPLVAATASNKGKQPGVVPVTALGGAGVGLNSLSLREPNTFAYAICDSPTGLLVLVLKALRTLGPRAKFTEAQIITFAQLAWVPGPEYALRFWGRCATHESEEEDGKKTGDAKPRVAITVFTGGASGSEAGVAGEAGDIELHRLPLLREGAERYACPAWGRAKYAILHTERAAGKPGLLAWERPDIIATGVRGLATELLRVDQRLRPSAPEPALTPLQKVIVAGDDKKDAPGPATQLAEQPKPGEGSGAKEGSQVPAPKSEEPGEKEKEEAAARQETLKSEEALKSDDTLKEEAPKDEGKGKEKEELSPPPPIRDPLFSDSSPDTLVVTTPPLESS
ncbi:alpha/beta-hydrolase [Thozetella sp. PMI_491]|nr:alpha/beta-hydrolase [Thozetella sp. PMI_491]